MTLVARLETALRALAMSLYARWWVWRETRKEKQPIGGVRPCQPE